MVKIQNKSKPCLHSEYLMMLGSILLWYYLLRLTPSHWTPATLLCCCFLNTPSKAFTFIIAWVSHPPGATSCSLKCVWVSALCHQRALPTLSKMLTVYHSTSPTLLYFSSKHLPPLMYYIIIPSLFVSNVSPMIVGTLLFLIYSQHREKHRAHGKYLGDIFELVKWMSGQFFFQ